MKVNDRITDFKLAYRAHKALSPSSSINGDVCERNRRLSAKQYRAMFQKVIEAGSREEMEEVLETLKF